MNISIIMFPVQNLTPLIFSLITLYSSILWLHKFIPFSPMWILHLNISLLICVSLFESYQFVEISQHINKNTTVHFSLHKIFYSKLNTICGFKQIDHLTDNILKVEFETAVHISQSL